MSAGTSLPEVNLEHFVKLKSTNTEVLLCVSTHKMPEVRNKYKIVEKVESRLVFAWGWRKIWRAPCPVGSNSSMKGRLCLR